MRFDVLTLFPEMLESVLGTSVIGNARRAGIVELNFVNIRDYTKDKHKNVIDTPYSGGGGMIMNAQPIYDAYMSVAGGLSYKPYTIYMSPQGATLTQDTAKKLADGYEHIVIFCGHYEGVDQRVIDEIADAEMSIGDFVLTGGEIPAMAVIDAVSRMIPGVLSNEDSYSNESHFNGLLEYPQYTKPAEWNGRKVPDILVSGHHAKIEEWRREQSLVNTLKKRPDLLEKAELTEKDKAFLRHAAQDGEI